MQWMHERSSRGGGRQVCTPPATPTWTPTAHATTETTPLGARIVRAHREPIDAITCLSMCAVRAQTPRKRFRVFTPT